MCPSVRVRNADDLGQVRCTSKTPLNLERPASTHIASTEAVSIASSWSLRKLYIEAWVVLL